MRLVLSLFIVSITFFGHSKDLQKRVIVDDNYNYTFYVSDKESIHFNTEKTYYWFRSGAVHSTVGGGDGLLLQGVFTKTFLNNDLSEQGSFYNGLKNGKWIEWYQNGAIKKITIWHHGLRSGIQKLFNESGSLLTHGRYHNDKKHGKWIKEVEKDTVYFKKGVVVPKDAEPTLAEQNEFSALRKGWENTKWFTKNIFVKKEKKTAKPFPAKSTSKKIKKVSANKKETNKTAAKTSQKALKPTKNTVNKEELVQKKAELAAKKVRLDASNLAKRNKLAAKKRKKLEAEKRKVQRKLQKAKVIKATVPDQKP